MLYGRRKASSTEDREDLRSRGCRIDDYVGGRGWAGHAKRGRPAQLASRKCPQVKAGVRAFRGSMLGRLIEWPVGDDGPSVEARWMTRELRASPDGGVLTGF